MPKLTGFEILELAEHPTDVIFTTAYDQYAIQAFEANAVDYLLKPFNRDRFANAVKKAIERYLSKNKQQKKVKSVMAAMDEKVEIIDRIAVRTGTKIQVIPADDILYLEADGDYVRINTNAGSFLKEKTMKYFETHLIPSQFIRIHRSYIVNINQVERLEYYDKESYMAVLKNHLSLKVSSSGYKTLKESLKI
jgi:two-component system LytT family response regulator